MTATEVVVFILLGVPTLIALFGAFARGVVGG